METIEHVKHLQAFKSQKQESLSNRKDLLFKVELREENRAATISTPHFNQIAFYLGNGDHKKANKQVESVFHPV